MKILFTFLDKIKQKLSQYFIAKDNDPAMVRSKHLRLGALVSLLFLVACYFLQNTGDAVKALENLKLKNSPEVKAPIKTTAGLDELAKGTSNELLWTEIEGKELEQLKENN